jgi:hypothetical protein
LPEQLGADRIVADERFLPSANVVSSARSHAIQQSFNPRSIQVLALGLDNEVANRLFLRDSQGLSSPSLVLDSRHNAADALARPPRSPRENDANEAPITPGELTGLAGIHDEEIQR